MDSNETFDGKARPRSRSRSRPSGVGKSYRNPYLNFVRDFRKSTTGSLSSKEVLIKAGKIWRKMGAEEKKTYIEEASMVSRDSASKKGTSKIPKESSDKKQNRRISEEKSDGRILEGSERSSVSSYDSD